MTPRYNPRTILLLLAILPPLLAAGWIIWRDYIVELDREYLITIQRLPTTRQQPKVPAKPRNSSDLEHGKGL